MPPPDPQANAVAVVTTLRDAGHVAYFAGGCVRDRLLGLTPTDYDVATDAPPERVRQTFAKTQAVGAAFGVVLVRLGGSVIEVATFRSDGRYADGRRPETVTFATAEADAQRRDFTINGLFYDPLGDRIIDYVGGQTDLSARVLRAIGDPAARFGEDHLRLLRAVRFAARFGLTIDPATAAAIDEHAPRLPRISAERVAEEVRRILTPPTRDIGYRLLWRHGLLRVLLPTLSGDAGVLDPRRSLLLRLPGVDTITLPLAWLAAVIDVCRHRDRFAGDLLDHLSPTSAAKLVSLTRRALRLSNDDLDAMAELARQCHVMLSSPNPDDATVKRFLARRTAPAARQLLEAIAAVGDHADRVAALRPRLETLSRGDVAPPPLLTGDTLIAAGARPGPTFKHILHAVYDAQLNGQVATAADALGLGLRLARDADV